MHRRRELAALTFLVVRDRTGLAQVVVPGRARRCRPRRPRSRSSARRPPTPQAPGGVEVTEPAITRADRAGRRPRRSSCGGPTLDAGLPDAARPRRRSPGGTRPSGRSGSSPRPVLRGFRDTLDGRGLHRGPDPEARGVGDRVAAPTSSRSTTSAGRRTSPRARSSTSSSWSASSSASTRSGRCSAPSRTTPCGTSRSTSRSTSSSASSSDHRDVLAVLRDVLAGMVAAIARARRRAPSSGSALDVPVVPEEIPVLHFREALALVGAPADEPDLAPAHERALGAWALAEHGSDFVAVEGYPMAKRPFYTPPAARTTRAGRNSFDLLFRGLELVTGGQRLHRPADYDAAIRAPRRGPGGVRGVPRGVRHGMPPHGGFAIGLERWIAPAGRGGQHPRGHAVPARPAPADALSRTRRHTIVARPRSHDVGGACWGVRRRVNSPNSSLLVWLQHAA